MMKKIVVIIVLIIAALVAGYFTGQFFSKSSPELSLQIQQEVTPQGNAWEKSPLELIALEDGKPHNIKEWAGKVMVLNFWATWCVPCRAEIPEFVEFQRNHADDGVQIIGIGLDEPAKLRGMEKELGMNYPTLVLGFEASAKVFKEWGNTAQVLPYTVVIARDGAIMHQHLGLMDTQTLEEQVLPLL
jgi:thiol-disulfide isomerase/thioredoxin